MEEIRIADALVELSCRSESQAQQQAPPSPQEMSEPAESTQDDPRQSAAEDEQAIPMFS